MATTTDDTWSANRPPMAGWYWLYRPPRDPVVVELFHDGERWGWRDNQGVEHHDPSIVPTWWGPRIPPPSMARFWKGDDDAGGE